MHVNRKQHGRNTDRRRRQVKQKIIMPPPHPTLPNFGFILSNLQMPVGCGGPAAAFPADVVPQQPKPDLPFQHRKLIGADHPPVGDTGHWCRESAPDKE